MKTMKILISITLIALATSSYAQPSTLKEKPFHDKADVQSVVYTSETEVVLEDWMTVPFQNEFAEELVSIESWMTEPFISDMEVDYLHLESWMTKPFETGTSVQEWMIADNRD